MDDLPNEILEKILTYKILNLADVSNVLQTCKYLRTTIQESNFIWKHVFTQRWPDLLSMINPEEVTDWFVEVRHVITLMSHITDICAHMASRFMLVNTLFPRDFLEWNKLVKSRKFNDIYIAKHLSFLRTEKCDINSIKALPCTTIGNMTLRYYADLAYHHFHQEKCLEELREYLKIPEKFRMFERLVTIIFRLLKPFEYIKYENFRETLDRLSVKAEEELREYNPLHPLFAISQEVQSSWKDQILDSNIFERSHLEEVLCAVDTVMYVNHDIRFIDEVLSTGGGSAVLPIITSVIYESICRRLGVHCELLNTYNLFQSFVLKTVCSGGVALCTAPSDFGKLSEEYVTKVSSAYKATSQEVMLVMLVKLETYFSLPENKSMLKFIGRLKVVLYPKQKTYLLKYPTYFREFKNVPYLTCSPRSTDEGTFESFENELFTACRSQELAEKYFNDQPNPTDEPIFPIGSIVVVTDHFSNKGVILGSTPYFVHNNYYDMVLVGTSTKNVSQTFYFILSELGQRYYASKDNLKFDENPSPLPDCLLYLGKYFTHFFVNHYVPNEHTNKLYPNNEKYRLAHYKQLLLKKQNFLK